MSGYTLISNHKTSQSFAQVVDDFCANKVNEGQAENAMRRIFESETSGVLVKDMMPALRRTLEMARKGDMSRQEAQAYLTNMARSFDRVTAG